MSQNQNRIPLRSEVAKEYTWATEDLYANDSDFLNDLDLMKEKISALGQYSENLTDNAENLYNYFCAKNNLMLLSDKVNHYSLLKSDEDTTNATYQNYKAKVSDLYVLLSSTTAFEVPAIISMNPMVLERYYIEKPELLFYKKIIDRSLRLAPHTLDKQGETLLAMTGEMAESSQNTFALLSNADMSFSNFKIDDSEYTLSQGSFVALLQNPDIRVRKAAFTNFYNEYDKLKNTFASTLNGQMKMLSFYAKASKYESTLEASLSSSEVDMTVYHNLISTVRDNLGPMHRYVKLRKKALKLDELHMYDIYAPLVANSKKTIPYEEAMNDVINAMSIYGDEYTSVLRLGFNNRWIDCYENKGKRSGAYSAGSFVHPYVLLNYKDNLDSEFTLAHEMGHAMHSYFSNKNQSPIYSQYSIFVAEVASTCNESLLMQYLLRNTSDKKERSALINYFLEQFKGTLYRQTMFAEFELMINELVASGESLTADILCEKYLELNKAYFGEEMILDKEIALEWARIPHFYYNYYVFQYATGFSAAIALSTKMLNEGESAIKKYLEFLSSGCTKDPISLLKDAGVDMSSPEPIKMALDLFDNLINEMEELL